VNTSLTNLNNAVDRLDDGLDHFEATLARIDDLMKRLVTLVAPVEAIVERIDYMVGIGETVMAPLSVTEHAVRNAFSALRNRGSR
jgi:ABC-type transporter Mla subunit MlaD